MPSRVASARGVSRSLFCLAAWGFAGGCATYENTPPATGGAASGGTETAGGGGAGGGVTGGAGSSVGGAPAAGGSVPISGMAGKGGGAGGSSAGAAGKPSGGAAAAGAAGAGAGTAGQAGTGGVAGGGGRGGSGGTSGRGGTAGVGGTGGTASGGGNGGSGGSVTVATCAKNPIPMKSTWVVTASSSSNTAPTANAHDGVLTNRWSTGKDQIGNEWLQLDFGATVTLTKATLALGASTNDYPRSYAARFSNTSMNQTAPVLVSGMGAAGTDTVLSFPKGTTGRYLLVTQSGMATALWWSVAEIHAECVD